MQKKYTDSFIQFSTSFGWLTVFVTTKGINRIEFGKSCTGKQRDEKNKLLQKVKKDILSYIDGKKVKFAYPLDISLTPFQKKALKEVEKIPYGKTISYKELARRTKNYPRACGQAVAKNPIPIIIPCHRVIEANGGLGGFGGGLQWKIKLLKLEKSNQ